MNFHLYHPKSGLFFRGVNCYVSKSNKAKLFLNGREALKARAIRTYPSQWWCVYRDDTGNWHALGKPNENVSEI